MGGGGGGEGWKASNNFFFDIKNIYKPLIILMRLHISNLEPKKKNNYILKRIQKVLTYNG